MTEEQIRSKGFKFQITRRSKFELKGYNFSTVATTNSATSASIIADDKKSKHKKILTWLTALHEWNAQKDLTGTLISLLLFLCDPRWLAWFCVPNKSKGTSKVYQNRIHGTKSLQSIQSW